MTSESVKARAIAPEMRTPGSVEAEQRFGLRASLMVAAAVGATTMAFNVWWPFLPLYALDLGAKSDADALFWVAVATTSQGVARLASGPVWGVISDRWGRKVMFLRALYLSSTIGAIAAFVTAPWQLAIPLGAAGLFSGFNPAAIALISVSVPDNRLNRSLSMITGAQYVGTTLGPAFGAILALVLDYRGAILFASAVPLITGTLVLFFVPRDETPGGSTTRSEGEKTQLEPFHASFQFVLAILLYFVIFAMNQLIRLATPIALRGIEGGDANVSGMVGLTFTLGGLISAISVLILAPQMLMSRGVRTTLVAGCAVAAAGEAVMAASDTTALYIAGFLLVAMVLSAITPTTNTLIAANVTRSRRGTAFGIASSAQALSFAVGPAGAAVFAAVSMQAGFVLLAGLLLGLGVLLRLCLREPRLGEEEV
jgi:DHA1 family multidrug resistance protein-like MFS transporter